MVRAADRSSKHPESELEKHQDPSNMRVDILAIMQNMASSAYLPPLLTPPKVINIIYAGSIPWIKSAYGNAFLHYLFI
jgi:hypothetical protein